MRILIYLENIINITVINHCYYLKHTLESITINQIYLCKWQYAIILLWVHGEHRALQTLLSLLLLYLVSR